MTSAVVIEWLKSKATLSSLSHRERVGVRGYKVSSYFMHVP
jgi:hypothetical protein